MRPLSLLLLVMLFVGCSSSTQPKNDASKKITWQEYQKMSIEQKTDPYVLDSLDDQAKKKLAPQGRKLK